MRPYPAALGLSLIGLSLFLTNPSIADTTSGQIDFIPEGRFESGLGKGEAPLGWFIDPPQWKNSPRLSVNLLTETADPSAPEAKPNSFVRLGNTGMPDEEGIFCLFLTKSLPKPTPNRLLLGWRVRAQIEATSRVQGWSGVQLTIRFIDAKGNVLSERREMFRLVRSTNDRWLERETTVDVPAGTTDIELLPGLYLVKGSVDFDDITVTPLTD